MKSKPSNTQRYGAEYVRQATRKHEQKVREGAPVYPALARRRWR